MAKSDIVQIDINTYQVTEHMKVLSEYGERIKDVVRVVKDPIDIGIMASVIFMSVMSG